MSAPAAVQHSERLVRTRKILDDLAADALLISRIAGRRWLSGFVVQRGDELTSGYSGTLLITGERQLVLADSRYDEQAERECVGWEVRHTTGPLEKELSALANELGVRRVGAEAKVLSHADWSALTDAGLDLVPADRSLRDLRIRKDRDEIEALERACSLTDACFDHLMETIRPGMTEREIAWELEGWFRSAGAEDIGFEPLVLVGPRAAMPHGTPSDVPVTVGEALLIDFGCQVHGYRSDMTRTVFFGEPSGDAAHLYQVVADAQAQAFEAAQVGAIGQSLDGVARQVIEAAGYGQAFTHGLGHGIGLETHEAPFLKDWTAPLEAGMVFTLEPGIYLPGKLGIRIEDDVVLTASGARRLTNAPRELITI